MQFTLLLIVICALLFVGLLIVQEAGRRYGRAQIARDPEGGKSGQAPIESAILALLGLLVAFTFNGAASRYEQRRELIGVEVNAIRTAAERLELVAPDARASLRHKVRLHLEARLAAYAALPDFDAAWEHIARSEELRDAIWSEAVPAAVTAGGAAPMLLLNALNAMFDIATTRLIAAQRHPPFTLYAMLGVLALLSGLPAGYAMGARKNRPVLHMVIYAAMLSLSVYVILDLEYPRLGVVRIDEADRNLERLLENELR